MKNKILLLFSFILALSYSFAQITNGTVNYELRADDFRQTCDNDPVSADDNEVRIGLTSDSNTGGTATWTSGGSGATCTGNNYVRRWQADAPSTTTTTNLLLYTASNRNFLGTFTVNKESWEEDDSPDCSSSGDACVSTASTAVSFRDATRTPCRFWSFGGAADVASAWSAGNSHISLKTVWRYSNGATCAAPLTFGTLTIGTTYTDQNSNRPAPTGSSASMGYSNVLGNTAQDVFYSFTISAPTVVTISTDNSGTNFDTNVRLYSSGCGGEIASDDDSGVTYASGLSSVLTRALCAGTYVVMVEGYSTNTGDFNLSIVANNLAAMNGGTIDGIANPTTICNGSDPGAFTNLADASGAFTLAAYSYGTTTYQWERAPTNTFVSITNVGTNSSIYDPDASLTAGTYFFRRKATDACGTVAYSNVIQVVVRPTPTASIGGTTTVCQNGTAPNITFTNPQSLPVTITYNINGSGTTMVNVGANTTATVAAPTTTPGSFAYNLVSVAYQTAPSCSNAITSTATLTVNPSHTLALSSASTTTTQTVCQSTAISPIVYAVGGGGGGAGVTGLPFGVTGNFASGNFTISGTPTQSGTFNYTVTTTGNGCTVATATGTITVHAALVLTPGGTNVSCNGGTNGTASVTAYGGTGIYTYSWYSGGSSSSLSGLGIGTYTVLVTSGACSGTTSYTVTQPSAITGSASAGASILCNGGTTTLTATASGGTGALQYSLNGGAYQSSNSFTVGAGTHTITVKDANNCTQALAAVVISQPSALVAKTCTNANDLCQVAQGQIKVVVSGGVAPYNVAWSPTHGTPSSPQSIGASGGAITISGLQGGVTYTFVVTDANGCVAP